MRMFLFTVAETHLYVTAFFFVGHTVSTVRTKNHFLCILHIISVYKIYYYLRLPPPVPCAISDC